MGCDGMWDVLTNEDVKSLWEEAKPMDSQTVQVHSIANEK